MGRFRFLDERSPENNSLGLLPGESIIGVYENDSTLKNHYVLVTDRGMLVRFKEVERHILFDEIECVIAPSEKQNDNMIKLVLSDGIEASFEITGAQGRFRDVFEFVRFLDRVLSDVGRRKNDNGPGSN